MKASICMAAFVLVVGASWTHSVRQSAFHAWAHDVRVTWEELRDGHMQDYRIERSAVVWTEAWRSRLE